MRNLYTLQKSLLRSSFKKRRLDTCSCSTAKSFSTSTTADGTRQFFEWLEKSFGGNLPMDESNSRSAEVLTSSKKIQLDDLQRLFNHDALAIHVKDFYPQSSAIQLANELAMEQDHAQNWKVSTAHGLESSDVLTLGATPYNMAVAKSKSDDDRSSSLDDYYEQVTQEFENRRRRQQGSDETSKMVWPLDQLRLELDEVWPSGAGLARNPQNPQQCKSGGLTRITKGPTRWKQGFIHVDEMAPLSSASGYFSANIYLQLPNNDNGNKSKGEPVLDIWPLGIRNRWDWYKVCRDRCSSIISLQYTISPLSLVCGYSLSLPFLQECKYVSILNISRC